MIGYVFDGNRKISLKIPNTLKCNATTLLGDEGNPNTDITAVVGTGQYIVTDQIFNVGDILPSGIVDQRSSIPILTT